MERDYQSLPIRELGEGAGYRRPTQPPQQSDRSRSGDG